MTQSICPDCGKPLDDESKPCTDCVRSIEYTEARGQSHALATIVFIILVIGIIVATGIVISMIVR